MEVKDIAIEPKAPVIRRIQRYIYSGKEYGSYDEVIRLIRLEWVRELLETELCRGERIDEKRVCELLLDLHREIEQILERDIRLETER